MKPLKFIIIGGSAGSLQVILGILAAVKPDFSLPLLVILHRNVGFESSLEEVIATRTDMPVKEVEEKEPIAPGMIYVCPADYHVLVEQDRSFSLDYSERVNFSRPSIDVIFRSAAEVYGEELACVLLSGGNADGAEGLQAVKEGGGLAIVQDPATADVPYMPQAAIGRMEVDFIVPGDALPDFLQGLVRGRS